MVNIAILTAGSSTHTKGIMNFVCEEVRQFKKRETEDFTCDVFMIRVHESAVLRFLLTRMGIVSKRDPDEWQSTFSVDGVTFHNIWVKEGIWSMFVRTRIKHKHYSEKNLKRITHQLKDYDYVITHKTCCQYVGLKLYEKFNIPFAAFWHGTELTTNTFSNKYIYNLTKAVLQTAHNNFFVSKALLNIAETVTEVHNGSVIYTGPSDMFFRYPEAQRERLRREFGVQEGAIVIAYAGNLIPLKNVMLLPSIFHKVQDLCPERQLTFWIIGNGELERDLDVELKKTGVKYVMHGKVQPNRMPDYMNCIDALLLISKKEGLGLVCLEAMKCGANAFGSLIGGIPEVVGEDNCAPLDENFVENISKIIADSINMSKTTIYDESVFSWKSAIDIMIERIMIK